MNNNIKLYIIICYLLHAGMIIGNQELADRYRAGTLISLLAAPVTVPVVVGMMIR